MFSKWYFLQKKKGLRSLLSVAVVICIWWKALSATGSKYRSVLSGIHELGRCCSRTFLVYLFHRFAGVSYGRLIAYVLGLICQRMFRTVGDR